jgi:hypothetical protein
MKREPVAIVNGFTTFIEALIALGIAFGLDWSAEQVGSVMAVVVAVGGMVSTIYARGQVTPVGDPRNSAGQPLT